MAKTNPGAKPATAKPYPKSALYQKGKQRTFSGPNLDQIAFPLGGIGAGQINLGGSGQLQDFSIFNKPALGTQPRASASIFAKPKGEEGVARVIEGPVTHSRIFNGGKHAGGGAAPLGFPHMKKATFRGEFPFAYMDFEDASLPVKVSLEAFSPFIPLDVKNSSIPAAILKYTFKNTTKKTVDAQFVYSTQTPFLSTWNDFWTVRDGCISTERSEGKLTGLEFTNEDLAVGHPKKGTFVVALLEKNVTVQETWYTGASPAFILWKEIASGKLAARKMPPRPTDPEAKPYYAEGGAIGASFSLKPGESRTIPLIVAWHVPDADANFGIEKEAVEKWEEETGKKAADAPAAGCSDGGCGCQGGGKPNPIKWRPYYVSHFRGAFDVAKYVGSNLESLEARTRKYHDLFFQTTFPSVVLDAVSANLGILKSPTCIVLENGQFWAFEGCLNGGGCCHGSCTHVWNYAQAMPHLFPQLERSLRSLELEQSMDAKGHVQFRANLPVSLAPHSFHAASDGQLGGIMKVWRDWQISGDDEWLKRMYPLAQKSLNYCIETWDPDKKGALYEAHHNTYDIEFWGPDGMCSSFYLGALRAMSEMAKRLGHDADAKAYAQLADKGMKFLGKEVFNGEYYFQKIQWTGLRGNLFDQPHWKNSTGEVRAITEKEGPPFQYGKGCLSDGVIGQWFADLFGLPAALDPEKTRKHLESVFKYNFKADMSEHSDPCRPTYAMNDEAGLLLCSWPKGGQLSIPFFYAPEVWTGIEYQVASHMALYGMVDEALTIVKGARDRYEGLKRNPWNEFECGSYYARALAIYGVFTALSGFRYSAVTQQMELNPQLPDEKMVSFFSTDKAWGKFTLNRAKGKTSVTIEAQEGTLTIKSLALPFLAPKKTAKASITGAKAQASLISAAKGCQVVLDQAAIVKPGSPVTIALG